MKMLAPFLLAAALVAPLSAAAQPAYPSQPVKFIVPYPPGGPTDLTARAYAEQLGRLLGQPVVVDNKPGAQGVPAVQQLLQMPADGHAIYFGTLSTQVVFHVINAYRRKPAPYDARKDLVPVSLLGAIPLVVTAGAANPANSLKELVAAAKAQPGTLNYGSDGIGSLTHLGGEMFNQAAGIQTTHIPYKGTAPFTQALVAGDIQYAFSGLAGTLALQQQGRTKIYAVAGPGRNAKIPNVPTVAESGYPGFDLTSWFAVFVRAGTDRAQVEALGRAIRTAAQSPELIARLATAGIDAQANTPEQFAVQVDADFRKWTEVITKAAIRFED